MGLGFSLGFRVIDNTRHGVGAAAALHDLPDLGLETHVKHPVRLVEGQELDLAQLDLGLGFSFVSGT